MDIVLEVVDHYVADRIYAWALPVRSLSFEVYSDNGNCTIERTSNWEYRPSTHLFYLQPAEEAYGSIWSRDNIWRQTFTLFFLGWVFAMVNYFFFATLSYVFVFDKATFKHPKYLKNQIRQEIKEALIAMPGISVPTCMVFLLEVRGYTRLYGHTAEGPGAWYDYAQIFFFILFTDALIYWIHRGLHHPRIYKWLHKAHHRWIMPTPYASYAFHPLDGFAQSAPYHLFPMLFPMHKFVFITAFMFVNLWTIMIHDGEYITDNPVINGAACHSAHHLYFNYNYGQFLTFWDRLGGSYRKPDGAWFDKQTKMSEKTWRSDVKEMERLQKIVEGDDSREYSTIEKKLQ
ncbi:c-5 sterol desaturase [Emericellopsis cladophorae]|uniref:C-5 sterol desaturase n=1 Tax=Emericellopsis cladophorae TaxID=2686198 RepID=A0A9Q0BDC5_9HYPO|nr:c-5 sterol desaturase [Emericellopsis cladophorae]KAI6780681.1 c-5 sterol desaturase [Emericellopsis cladophorae]